MYAAALHILGNHSDADDATQEAFVRAYRGLPTFDGRADFFTWLYRITVNTALNALRGGKRGAALAAARRRRGRARRRSPRGARPGRADPAQKAQQAAEVARVLDAIASCRRRCA